MVKIGNIELGNFPLLLAPMEDVSDPPFRAVCKENGADVMYTEFSKLQHKYHVLHSVRPRIFLVLYHFSPRQFICTRFQSYSSGL